MKDTIENKNKKRGLGYALKARKYMHIGIIPLVLFLLKITFGHPRSLSQNNTATIIGIYIGCILLYLIFYGTVNVVIYLLKKKDEKKH